ncbi:MAG: SlyX family protein [Sulfurimicrobium sp.]|jgi:SlyX protein|nr:SlyX family protein [Sulfurimicrobium sp.]MDP1704359.1 SlyX family protein [Sulfurimicrobium sp.]MDP1897413.1 SlyX family protein [Sulfurimicrobium sp.]MDP2198355.1 SlyX family protein [Sulfurimicrobium sp.]MDP2963013.1 SlyX family protein [Sulfurimicrobium sp.]
MIEERLIEIENKICYQEDTVQELNKVIYQQQKQIDRLEAICSSLVNHVRDISDAMAENSVANEKPPHY